MAQPRWCSKKFNELALLLVGLLGAGTISTNAWAAGERSAQLSCFSPTTDPVITSVLKPQAAYHETAATIAQMNKLIFDHRDLIDPRLVYHRMVGESMGQAEVVNPRDGGYGLFQFTGRPYHSRYTYRQILQQLYRKSPGVSHRLIQLEYYLDVYVPTAARAADQGYGCNRSKKFSQYTNLEKVSYLGWGTCSAHAMQRERGLCHTLASYRQACTFSEATILGSTRQPLCYQGSEQEPYAYGSYRNAKSRSSSVNSSR